MRVKKENIAIPLAVLASGQGTNFMRLVEAARGGEIPGAQVACLISDRQTPALEQARKLGVISYLVEPKKYETSRLWMEAILSKLQSHKVSLIALAGFLRKIEEPLLSAYKDRILNIHPALLPKYGGPGMWGARVHEKVLENKDKETGVTVHLVDAVYDHGPIVLQEKIPVEPWDTPPTLAKRVHELEYKVYPKAIALYLKKLEERGA